MKEYEIRAYDEIYAWKFKMLKRSGMLNRLAKKAQTKVNGYIPEKAHAIITDSIKNMVKAVLAGSQFTARNMRTGGNSLAEMDAELMKKLDTYKKTAAVEGAGTGAGGILLGLADFPLLLSIKMKFMFDAAAIYGFDTSEYEERLFILQIFHFAFSSEERREQVWKTIENWDTLPNESKEVDWRVFQQEYRDHIDFVKMLQLMPGIGAAVGAYANYNLLDHLGEAAKNIYRLRKIKTAPAAE